MKALLDTNVLIGFFRDPRKRDTFEATSNRPLLFMSSIVAMELFAGCRTAVQRSALTAFLKPFEKAGRLVTPSHAAFLETGRILALLAGEGIGKAHLRQMSNDVVIAVSAARAGLVVVTRNSQDFSRIARWTPVRWVIPE